MLARRAASGFPPTAYSQRPQTSRVVRTRQQTARPATTKIEYGSQLIEPPPIVCTIEGMPEMSVPSDAQSARPRTMLSVASVTMNGCGTRP